MIDIIIINYKGYEMTENLIKNIIDITKYKEYKIWVIDNSKDVLKFNMFRDKWKRLGVEWLENLSNNTSYPAGINLGIKQTNNDIIVFNNDMLLYDEMWLSKMIEAANKNTNIGLVELSDEKVVDKSKRQPTYIVFNNYLGITHNDRVSLGICYIKRKLIDSIGLIDEDNFEYGGFDDDDYCLRARLNGWNMDVVWSNYKHLGGIDTKREFGNKITEYMTRAKNNFNNKWKHLGVVRI